MWGTGGNPTVFHVPLDRDGAHEDDPKFLYRRSIFYALTAAIAANLRLGVHPDSEVQREQVFTDEMFHSLPPDDVAYWATMRLDDQVADVLNDILATGIISEHPFGKGCCIQDQDNWVVYLILTRAGSIATQGRYVGLSTKPDSRCSNYWLADGTPKHEGRPVSEDLVAGTCHSDGDCSMFALLECE
jgi:hypothetical protein